MTEKEVPQGWHVDAYQWMIEAGIPPEELVRGHTNLIESQKDQPTLFWNPQTLKDMSTSAFRISSVLGQAQNMMKLMAATELNLFQLRERIGIDRKAPPDAMPRVSAFVIHQGTLISPGKWVPDILDRAACYDPIHALNRHSIGLNPDEIATFRLDFGIILGAVDHWPRNSSDEKWDDVSILPLNAFPKEVRPLDIPIKWSRNPQHWIRSSPSVFRAVHEAAELIHLN